MVIGCARQKAAEEQPQRRKNNFMSLAQTKLLAFIAASLLLAALIFFMIKSVIGVIGSIWGGAHIDRKSIYYYVVLIAVMGIIIAVSPLREALFFAGSFLIRFLSIIILIPFSLFNSRFR